MASPEFREATREDEAVLFPMMRRLAEQEPGKIPFDENAAREAFRKLLEIPAFGRVWFFSEGGRPAGYIILTVGFSFEFHGYDAYIDELYVEVPFRRRGFGRQAVAFLEARAREMGVNAVHLEVDDGNDPASELYRRSGYEDHDRHLMTKWLKKRSQ